MSVTSSLGKHAKAMRVIADSAVSYGDARDSDLMTLCYADTTVVVERMQQNECSRFLRSCYQCIIDLLKIYGLGEGPYIEKEIAKTLEYAMKRVFRTCKDQTYVIESCIKFMKYKTCAFFAWGLDQALPPNPYEGDKPGVILGGRIGRWLSGMQRRAVPPDAESHSWMSTDYFDWLGLLDSIKKCKRGMPRPDKPMALRSLTKTFSKLTTPIHDASPMPSEMSDLMAFCRPYLGPKECSDEFDTDDKYSEVLYRHYVRTVMRNADFSFVYSLDMPLYTPSRSANYLLTRSELGNYGDLVNMGGFGDVAFKSIFLPEPDKRPMALVCETGQLIEPIDQDKARACYLFSIFSCYKAYAEDLDPEGAPVSIFNSVIEALKVRVISKGSGAAAHYLKPMQNALWGYLRDFPQFRIDKPIELSDLDVIGRLEDDEKFLSIDYEDSTNNLHQRWSKIATELIIEENNVDPIAAEMWRSTLYGGKVGCGILPTTPSGGILDSPLNASDEKSYFAATVPAAQVRGQLMGNIMSFPILCLANGFVCWCTRMVSTGMYQEPLCDYIVNGDDAVLRCTTRGYAFTEALAKAMGVPLSIGKVYFSRHFFDINSEVYTRRDFSGRPWMGPRHKYQSCLQMAPAHYFDIVPYVHSGLLECKTRTGEADLLEIVDCFSNSFSVGGVQNRLLIRCPPQLETAVMKAFYQKVMLNSTFHRYLRNRSWYLPPCLGGLGLTPVIIGARPKPSFTSATECRRVDRGRLTGVAYMVNPGSQLTYDEVKIDWKSGGRVVRTSNLMLGPSVLDLRIARLVADDLHKGRTRLPTRPMKEPAMRHAAPISVVLRDEKVDFIQEYELLTQNGSTGISADIVRPDSIEVRDYSAGFAFEQGDVFSDSAWTQDSMWGNLVQQRSLLDADYFSIEDARLAKNKRQAYLLMSRYCKRSAEFNLRYRRRAEQCTVPPWVHIHGISRRPCVGSVVLPSTKVLSNLESLVKDNHSILEAVHLVENAVTGPV